MAHTRMLFRSNRLFAALVLALLIVPSSLVQAQSALPDTLVTLSFSSTPEAVEVRADSQLIGTTPVHFQAQTARTYVFSYKKEGFVTRTDTVALRSAADSTVGIHLFKPATLRITSVPSNAFVYVGERSVGRSPVVLSGLTPDTVTITIRDKFSESWRTSLAPRENDTISVNALLKSRETLLNVFATPPEATIYLDGEALATGRLINYSIEAGPHSLRVRDDRTGREASMVTTPSAEWMYVYRANLGFNSIERGMVAAIIPGSAQLIDKDYLKGTAMLVGTLGLGFYALSSQSDYLNRRDAYDYSWIQYIAARTEDEAFRRHGDMEAKKTELDKAYARRTISMGLFAACYIYSLADALLWHLADDTIEVVPAADIQFAPQGIPVSSIPLGAEIKVKF